MNRSNRLRAHGIIPACAGSTSAADLPTKGCGDHPRVRGEHEPVQPLRGECMGSSPRARGAQFGNALGVAPVGIIPACAGSTCGRGRRAPRTPDHPRVRGEHSIPRPLSAPTPGSSPRARGAPGVAVHPLLTPGIIPACAGSTRRTPRPSLRARDHPRVRGEHVGVVAVGQEEEGSSPRARGARRRGCSRPGGGGIIPACAGSTTSPDVREHLIQDHPRVRGEHLEVLDLIGELAGSSPRARGAQGRKGSGPWGGGDHPRVRGEHACCHVVGEGDQGSSPRARGAHGAARQ